VTGPHGAGAWSPPGPVGPPRPRRRRLPVALASALAGLVVLSLAALFVLDGRLRPDGRPVVPLSPGPPVSSSALEGAWSGGGTLTRCAGIEEEDCAGTRSITLTIGCSPTGCAVTPFDRGYGRPPLRFEDGLYRAAGPVPADLAPTCDGVPTRSALWRLELTVRDGRLYGSYAESTVQGFDCGATGLAWAFRLDAS
jgi:hypothetical protein